MQLSTHHRLSYQYGLSIKGILFANFSNNWDWKERASDDSSTPGSTVRLITSRASQNRPAKAIRFIAPEIALRLLSITSLTVPARDSLSSSSLPFLAFRHTAKILFCNLFLSNARRWMVEKLIFFLFQFEFFLGSTSFRLIAFFPTHFSLRNFPFRAIFTEPIVVNIFQLHIIIIISSFVFVICCCARCSGDEWASHL